MTIEHASVHVARKPWGVADLHPWSGIDGSGDAVGELWFRRPDKSAPDPALLLKLLFTSEPLSIQVHPDDAFARSIGLPNGKTEAWYILAATADARVAVGLKRHLTTEELRAAIGDGSIAALAQWRSVAKDDIIFVPAGTIHAIGAGIVLAEFSSTATRHSVCSITAGSVNCTKTAPSPFPMRGRLTAQAGLRRLTDARTALTANPHFVLERIDLRANSRWLLNAKRETWILVIDGHATIGSISASVGDAVFAEADRADIEVGPAGMSGLVAYPGPDPTMSLLEETGEHMTKSAGASAAREPKPKEIVEAQT